MQLEADRFANNQWADAEFTREIEVVKEERRLRTDDNPRARLYEALSADDLRGLALPAPDRGLDERPGRDDAPTTCARFTGAGMCRPMRRS